MTSADIRALARDCGFELAGVAPALPAADRRRYQDWAAAGWAGEMRYLTDRRAELRDDPRRLLPSAHSIIVCRQALPDPLAALHPLHR